MSTTVECPGCGKRYKVSDGLAGQTVWCGCGRTLTTVSPVGGSQTSQQQVAAANLLDETIWDAERKVEPRDEAREAQVNTSPVAKLAPGVPAAADDRSRPTPAYDTEYEPETFWVRVKSLNRELVAWLAMGYGIWMLVVSLAITALVRPTFSFLLILVLSPLVIAGGVLIKKRHPLGSSFAGLASAGIAFFVILQTVMSGFSLAGLVVIFVVQFMFFYFAPAYIIYWCLKEEEAMDEEARRDDHYAIRDSLKGRMMEENRKDWESK